MKRSFYLLLALALFSTAICAQEDPRPKWKLLTTANTFFFQYNANQVIHTPEGTIKFWVKMSPTVEGLVDDQARDDMIGLRQKYHQSTKGYDRWGYTLTQYEVHCSQQRYRILTWADYRQSGDKLDSGTPAGDWQDIIPDSLAETMLKKMCKLG